MDSYFDSNTLIGMFSYGFEDQKNFYNHLM